MKSLTTLMMLLFFATNVFGQEKILRCYEPKQANELVKQCVRYHMTSDRNKTTKHNTKLYVNYCICYVTVATMSKGCHPWKINQIEHQQIVRYCAQKAVEELTKAKEI